MLIGSIDEPLIRSPIAKQSPKLTRGASSGRGNAVPVPGSNVGIDSANAGSSSSGGGGGEGSKGSRPSIFARIPIFNSSAINNLSAATQHSTHAHDADSEGEGLSPDPERRLLTSQDFATFAPSALSSSTERCSGVSALPVLTSLRW